MKIIRELKGFGTLSIAEQRIVKEIGYGQMIELGGFPERKDCESRSVRAGFIRYLALGGCKKCVPHEKGLIFQGAYIVGTLDLEVCEVLGNLEFYHCIFVDRLELRGAIFNTLRFDGSELRRGMMADQVRIALSLHMNSASAKREVFLRGAKIEGDLECGGATFFGADENGDVTKHSLSADGIDVFGNVYLQNVSAHGAVRFLGARIGRDLVCSGGAFRKAKETEKQKEEGIPGDALSLDGINVSGNLFLRGLQLNDGSVKKTKIDGVLKLDAASVGVLLDDVESWPQIKGHIRLNRFSYKTIMSDTLDAKARMKWLALQDPKSVGLEFWSQPYEQLASVLKRMGHGPDARAILIEKERLQREACREKCWTNGARLKAMFLSVWDFCHGITTKYGHQPLETLLWLIIFLTIGTVVFSNAEAAKALSTNAKGYATFHPFIYSADVLLPIVDFGYSAPVLLFRLDKPSNPCDGK